jgi:hypothetical protein
MYGIALFEYFFKILSLYLEARIRVRIRIKVMRSATLPESSLLDNTLYNTISFFSLIAVPELDVHQHGGVQLAGL